MESILLGSVRTRHLRMTDSEFEDLVWRVFAGKASPAEAAALHEHCNAHPQRRMERERIEADLKKLRANFDLALAIEEAGPADAGQVASFMRYVETDRAERLARHRRTRTLLASALALAAGVAIALGWIFWKKDAVVAGYVVIEAGTLTIDRDGQSVPVTSTSALYSGDLLVTGADTRGFVITPDGSVSPLSAGKVQAPEEPVGVEKPLRRFLTSASVRALATLAPSPTVLRGVRDGAIHSPSGLTRYLDPPVVWRSADSETWTVAVSEAVGSAPPMVAAKAMSPLAWTALSPQGRLLAPNRNYRVSITRTGETLEAAYRTFATSPDASARRIPRTPADGVKAAVDALQRSPSCPGDALAELQLLPAPFADSELAIRLRLAAFAQIGAKEDYEETLALLKKRA